MQLCSLGPTCSVRALQAAVCRRPASSMANEDLSRALVDKDPVPQFISMFCTCWSAWQSSERTAGDVLIFSRAPTQKFRRSHRVVAFPDHNEEKHALPEMRAFGQSLHLPCMVYGWIAETVQFAWLKPRIGAERCSPGIQPARLQLEVQKLPWQRLREHSPNTARY